METPTFKQTGKDITNTSGPKMNCDESISIDLTEDDVDYGKKQRQVQFVNCNDVNMYESVKRSSSQTKQPNCVPPALNTSNKLQDIRLLKNTAQGSPLLDITKVSTLNFIETLQKENPQIETVFIDSDEGEQVKRAMSPPVKIHNMVIMNSPQGTSRYEENNFLSNVGKTHNATIMSKTTTSAKKSQSVQKTEGVPFTVRAISSSKLNDTFANNGITIALPNETNTSARKFLVIPKEVAPLLVNSQGPITFNVPGLGPLLIPNPSDIFVSQPALHQINKPYQEQQEHRKVSPQNTKIPVYEPLSDTKYCWRYQRHRKRDLEGFTMSDRLGFYKAEQQRSKMCAAKYYDICKKWQMSIRRKEVALAAIRSSKLTMENIKLVEIDSIRKGRKVGSLRKTNHVTLKTPSKNLKEKNKFSSSIHCAPSIERFSSDSDSQISNDLLVTKKVVFINETTHPRGRKKKKRQGQFTNQQTQKRNQSDLESLKSEISYQAVSSNKKQKRKVKDKSDPIQIKSVRPKGRPKIKKNITNNEFQSRLSGSDTRNVKHIWPVRYTKRGESSKLSVTESKKQLSHIKDYGIKPCQVEILHNNLVEEAVEKYNDYTFKCIKDLVNTCKIIQDLTEFQNEIQPIKPILVINEDHCASVKYKEVFCKYNIIFPMLEITRFLNLNITNMPFVEAAKKGYVKFVHPSVLSRYIAGFRDPPQKEL